MSERYAVLDALLDDLYATISGPAGAREWSRERELFHPLARMMRTGIDERGRPRIKIMSVSEYIADVTPFLADHDFYELEVGREVTRFGNIAQVRSVYEARTALAEPDRPVPLDRRGVNLIQLFHDGTRWWVLSVLWDNERDGVRVPDTWRSSSADGEARNLA